MTFRLGLTGSIGTGKSTTAKLFEKEGCAVWDADAAVHRLYDVGGDAVDPIRAVFPDAIEDGAVSRAALKQIIEKDPGALKKIEQIVHPLVAQDRAAFLAKSDADVTVFDIPLLFENGTDAQMDAVVVVSIGAKQQRERVLQRATMTEAQFEHILSKQMPDAEKRARADYVVITDTVEHAAAQVHDILKDIRGKQADA